MLLDSNKISSISDYRSGCFASTQCKVFKPNETWPLAPFCGRSRCVALKVSKYQLLISFYV